MALTELLASLTWGQMASFGGLFLFVAFVVDFSSQPSYPEEIPMMGYGRGWWAKIRNGFAYFAMHNKWMREGYEKYGKKGLPFVAPAPISRPADVILPQSQIRWMVDQPDNVLSSHRAHEKILYMGYNFLGGFSGLSLNSRLNNDHFPQRVIHKYIARHLSSLIPAVEDEVKHAVEHVLRKVDTEDWTSINLWDVWMAIVPRLTSRILVGEGVCRDEEFLAGMMGFTDDVARNSVLMHIFPRVLHPIFGRLLTLPNLLHWRRANKRVMPVIEKRLHDMTRKAAGDPEYADWSPPEDFLTWDIRLAMEEKNAFELDPAIISKRLLPIQFAAIHTTVLTGQHWMFDLLASAVEKDSAGGKDNTTNILDTLRAEILAERPGSGHWSKATLSTLIRMDSSIRESQRLSNFGATLLERQVVAPGGVHHPEYGWTLPEGAFVTVNLQGTHHDEDIYDNADKYDPLRFAREREAWDQRDEEDRKANVEEGTRVRGLGMVTTSDRHLAFGHGRHACPGRFFVAYELKLIMIHLLTHYDFKVLEKRPQPPWIGATIIPLLKDTVEVRRRAKPL